MLIADTTEIEFIDGRKITLAEFESKVLLVVNTATKCGFTPQLIELERLWQRFKGEGLVVIGFPSAQFFQEPGDDQDVEQVCQSRYGVTFPLTRKVNVNGRDAHPLFRQLKKAAPGFLGSKAIKWNFTKFLVDRERTSVERFATATSPGALEERVRELLSGSEAPSSSPAS